MLSGLIAKLKRWNILSSNKKKKVSLDGSNWSRLVNMRLQVLAGAEPDEVQCFAPHNFPIDVANNSNALREVRKRALAYWTIPGHSRHGTQDNHKYTPDCYQRLSRLCKYEEGLPFLADAELMWEQDKPKDVYNHKTSGHDLRFSRLNKV